ncbi:hypothetical protein BC826DRAFT_967560 [Russula brevipes]|nr:hypothetical protein BC826DRAFT_967560 [Russula brevipes]
MWVSFSGSLPGPVPSGPPQIRTPCSIVALPTRTETFVTIAEFAPGPKISPSVPVSSICHAFGAQCASVKNSCDHLFQRPGSAFRHPLLQLNDTGRGATIKTATSCITSNLMEALRGEKGELWWRMSRHRPRWEWCLGSPIRRTLTQGKFFLHTEMINELTAFTYVLGAA